MPRAEAPISGTMLCFREEHASRPELIALLLSTLGYFGLQKFSDNDGVFFRKVSIRSLKK
jgi:hypothetical protein